MCILRGDEGELGTDMLDACGLDMDEGSDTTLTMSGCLVVLAGVGVCVLVVLSCGFDTGFGGDVRAGTMVGALVGEVVGALVGVACGSCGAQSMESCRVYAYMYIYIYTYMQQHTDILCCPAKQVSTQIFICIHIHVHTDVLALVYKR
jgi:hypothetical protein